ncbi:MULTISPECIES: prepilin-type N-terminal cleavage/methylation domain-containing protein [unclassified Wenzhouxiangella]|uniref:prepilin-type N-terminal cleavage/methylation domain-containing protein n=1 Tax=unclassified Wenzhouxiangella TaxID=2613841 RepID=UPI000E32CB53|nr:MULTISPECIES: prepilin-type N-terminal cleavage/methylation domain-containing protein [unclassified Wenzhouxiangella]RFF28500.1 type II secretion system protein GspH [Wenzhouxiangella sp. 15181]RFP70018.1 type II secretion system protein GspH [Wenzhouxiangella sp. 15190]
MQRSATGRTSGFTLIEVLVVVTIAAIVASLVILRLGTWRSGAEPVEQLDRLAALIDYQCEQALFQSKPRGVRLTSEGYDFWQSTGSGWAPLPDDEVARPRAWQGSVDLDLVVEDRAVALEAEPDAPQLVCQPLGEMTDFNLELRLAGQTAALTGDPAGQLALENRQ